MKNTKNNTRVKRLLIAMGVVLLILSYVIAFMTCRYVRAEVTKNSFNNIQREAVATASEINLIINKDKKLVNLIADTLAAGENIHNMAWVNAILNSYEGDDWMEEVILVYPDNSVLLGDGTVIQDFKGLDYDEEIGHGKHVSGKISSQIKDYGDVVRVYSPVVCDGEAVALVYGIINLGEVSEKFSKSLYSDKLNLYVVESVSGDILVDATGKNACENIDEMIDGHMFKKGMGKCDFSEKIKDKKSAKCAVYSDSAGEYVYFNSEPVGDGDWTVIISAKESDILNNSYGLVRKIEICTMILGLLAVIYVGMIIYVGTGQRKRISDEKDDFERIVQGTMKLFCRYALVNLDKNTYEFHVRNESDKVEGMADKGCYDDFVNKVFAGFVPVDDENGSMKKYFERDNLYESMKGDNDILMFEYVDTGNRQYRTLSILCLERRGSKPVKLLFASQDITDLKLKEEKYRETLKVAFDTAERANKAKSQFLSNMSHDIRTPLNAIIGMGAIAETYMDDKERLRHALDTITASGRHLLGMVNDVLDMSKIESGTLSLSEENVNISELIENATDLVRAEIVRKGLKFSFEVQDVKHQNIVGDGQRIEQLFANLLSNAVKYTPEGGKVSVTVMEKNSANPKLGRYKIVVSDTGIGMSREYCEHIFEPFTREERVNGTNGTGLGMSIVKNIINMMGGSIHVDSEIGKGTTFTVQLSLKLQNEQNQNEEADIRHDFSGSRVLLAEDNSLNMEIAVEILKMFGIEVETAENGQVAINMFKERTSWYYDMIFMDIRMPEMDGYEATRQIRALGGRYATSIPIVAMTANAFAEDAAEAARAGMNEHVAKPIEVERLLKVLDKWIK